MSNPWDRPEHRYTPADLQAMQRNEFDQRRALHGLYAGLLDGADVAARFTDPAHPVRRVSADVDLDANGTVPLVEVRHGHLQRAIVQPDVKFGDSVTPELYRQWAAQVGLDQGVSSQGRLDELYMSFHERQHAELSALGRSRIEAAKAFMDGIVKREALRHAASSLGADTSLYSGQTGMQAGQGLPPTPWLRDDNRYTWADVANMSRGEFDRRRELHVIYGAETPHVVEDFSRRMLGTTPLHNHVRTMYDNASWRARAHDRVYDDLLANVVIR